MVTATARGATTWARTVPPANAPPPPSMRDRPPHRELRPLLFTKSEWVLLRLTEFISVSAVSRGLPVCRPYPRRL